MQKLDEIGVRKSGRESHSVWSFRPTSRSYSPHDRRDLGSSKFGPVDEGSEFGPVQVLSPNGIITNLGVARTH
jgi:hypothetical protein